MADSLPNNEERGQTALKDFHDGFYPNVKQAAQAFDLLPRIFPKTRPKERRPISETSYESGFKRCSRTGGYLNIAKRLGIIGQSPRPGMFTSNTNYILQLANPGKPPASRLVLIG